MFLLLGLASALNIIKLHSECCCLFKSVQEGQAKCARGKKKNIITNVFTSEKEGEEKAVSSFIAHTVSLFLINFLGQF